MDLGYLVRAGLGLPDYWHPQVDIQPGFLNGELGLYPVSMDIKAEYPGDLDQHGIPIVYWGPNGTAVPSPVNIILYGLGSHDAFVNTGNEMYRIQMQCVLRWMERNATPLGDGKGWSYEVDLPAHRLRAPWSSSIVQGFALSLLLRAHKQNLPGPWKGLAYECWKGFHASIEEGGFRREVGDGTIYEEYPGPELDCVFNGICYALVGLWEAWQSGAIRGAQTDFQRGIAGLHPLLPRFAHGQWSLYSLSSCLKRPMLASPYYHRINGLMACVVGQMSGEREFIEYGTRWLRANSPARRIAVSLRIGMERFLVSPSMLQRDKSKKSA